MRPLLIVKSIPLSLETVEAWRAVDALFLKRSRHPNEYKKISPNFGVVINYGNSRVTEVTDNLWNLPSTISILSDPRRSRQALHDLMPEEPEPGQIGWIKKKGFGGDGKIKIQSWPSVITVPGADYQRHIEGTEYRINTVEDLVVQCHIRKGPNTDRHYRWLRMNQVPNQVKDIAREGARRLEERSIVAWDIILDPEGKAYILEGNTSPGVNKKTTPRIMTQVHKIKDR